MFGVKTMKCKECGNEILYNNHYHCFECDNCKSTYNALGNTLAPLDEWKDEYDSESSYEDY